MTSSTRFRDSSDRLDERSLPPSNSPGTAESILPPPPQAPEQRISGIERARELGEVLLLLLRVGTLLACSGAAAFRVRSAMERTAVALGCKRSEFVVTIDSIAASVFDGSEFRTQVVRLPPVGVDMNQLCRIEMLSRTLLAHPGERTPSEINRQLDELQAAPRLYPRWLTVPALGAACAAFCAAGHGKPFQIACAFVGAAAGHTCRLGLLARRLPLVTIVVACSFISCLATELVAWPLSRLSLDGRSESVTSGVAILASVLYLIPGVPLVTSLIDLVHFDLSAGLSRAAYAAVLVGCISVGVFGFFAVASFLPW